jgi:hypothetical protein
LLPPPFIQVAALRIINGCCSVTGTNQLQYAIDYFKGLWLSLLFCEEGLHLEFLFYCTAAD